jgi:ATP-dependent Clp protease ATP-binding subunit ClpA
MLNHNYIGTEHILLGLIHEGEGVAAKALESLGIELTAVRQRVEAIIGLGQEAQSGHIPFTPRAKKVLELSLREALQLSHNYIGTEHILLGLIREGEGVAAQVLADLGADLNRVRQRVIQMLHGYQGKRLAQGGEWPAELSNRGERRMLAMLRSRLGEFETRLAAIEQRVGTGADTRDLDEQIDRLRRDKEAAVAEQDYERAASLRDEEKRLLEEKAARQREWEAEHPALPSLAQASAKLGQELARLRDLIREHGIETGDGTA